MNLNITKGQVFKYALLPQVFPRFRELISSGFQHLAYFMALVYRAANLLPDNHAYLKTKNIGKYTIQNVFTETANNLVFDLKHLDQIIIFFALIAGLFLLVFQFFFLLMAIFINPTMAQALPLGIGDYFDTQNPNEDIALRLLDSVFGVPTIFGSQEVPLQDFHVALHALFQLYSFGLLVIAVIILLYFIFAILAETAQTGTPFGKRYNHVWAPIRLVVGIGMLVPMTFGLNAGQWITLYAAKFGSGFATTGWELFNDTINDHYIDPQTLVGTPEVPDLKDIVAFMMLAKACVSGYEQKNNINDMEMYVIDGDGGNPQTIGATNFIGASEMSDGENIYLRIGQHRPQQYTDQRGGVFPFCGEIALQSTDKLVLDAAGNLNYGRLTGAHVMNAGYYVLLKDLWLSGVVNGGGVGTTAAATYNPIGGIASDFMNRRIGDGDIPDPTHEYKEQIVTHAETFMREAVTLARDQQITIDFLNGPTPDVEYDQYGWGGAALWYNKIAGSNGQLTSGVLNKPVIKLYPAAMTYTCEQNQQQNKKTAPHQCYDPNLSEGKKVQFLDRVDENLVKAFRDLYNYWYKDPSHLTGHVFIDVINAILGTEGLFHMCKNTEIHPLAQLSSLGKGMIEAAIRNLGISFGSGAAGILTPYFGSLLDSASSFFGTMASIGILIGFILYYIVPFLPFLFFFFAVGGWIKGIFEAMVGVPLWALAHLRIDGEGLPGDAAINGYFLIFEIFVRPLLIIFGLISSILIFSAMVKVLNNNFSLAISNLAGFDHETGAVATCQTNGVPSSQATGTIEWMRGPVDELFFTVIYAIIVYMVGMSSFKLIDLIPNNILRWMGQGVQTFNDQSGEPADGLLQKVAIGGSMLSSQLQMAGQLKQGISGFGKGVTEIAKKVGGN